MPWDENSSFLRGPAEAPERIREVMASGSSNLCAEDGHDLGADRRFRVLGDVELDSGKRALAQIEQAVSELLSEGVRVLALGGDHAVTWPVVRAYHAVYPELSILHLDAHPDLYDSFEGSRTSHACPFARIMESGLARRLVQVGIRTINPEQRAQAERFGVEVCELRDGIPDLRDLEPPLYVSIDLDALDPAFAPGVSHHEPGGLSVRDIVRMVQDLPVAPVGADVVELNPRRDLGDATAMVAVKLVKELAARMLR